MLVLLTDSELHIITPKKTVIFIFAATRISNLTRMRSDCRKHCCWIRKIRFATFMMPLCLYKAASARYWPLEDTQMLNETQPFTIYRSVRVRATARLWYFLGFIIARRSLGGEEHAECLRVFAHHLLKRVTGFIIAKSGSVAPLPFSGICLLPSSRALFRGVFHSP